MDELLRIENELEAVKEKQRIIADDIKARINHRRAKEEKTITLEWQLTDQKEAINETNEKLRIIDLAKRVIREETKRLQREERLHGKEANN